VTVVAVDAEVAPTSRQAERLVILGVAGIVLAGIQRFGPALWPFGLGSSWSPLNQAWLFSVDLLWVAAMLIVFRRDPAGAMWKLFLLLQAVGAFGVIWVIPTHLTWTMSQLSIGVSSVVFVHLVLAFPSGRLSDPFDRRVTAAAYGAIAITRLRGCQSARLRQEGLEGTPFSEDDYRQTVRVTHERLANEPDSIVEDLTGRLNRALGGTAPVPRPPGEAPAT